MQISDNEKMKRYGQWLLRESCNKDIIFIFSNCQGVLLAWMMLNSNISQQFDIILLEPNFVLAGCGDDALKEYLKSVRIHREKRIKCRSFFVYTPIPSSNILNDNVNLRKVIGDHEFISFPYLVNTGCFPLYETRRGWVGLEGIKSGKDVERVLGMEWFFGLRKRYSDSLGELRKREIKCDVRLADFIEDNYDQQRLFYKYNHPCPTLGLSLYQAVISRMDIVPTYPMITKGDMDSHYLKNETHYAAVNTAISPYVYKELGWKWAKCHDSTWEKCWRFVLSQLLLRKTNTDLQQTK